MPFYSVFCAAAACFAVLYKTLSNNVCTNLVFLEESNFFCTKLKLFCCLSFDINMQTTLFQAWQGYSISVVNLFSESAFFLKLGKCFVNWCIY